MLVSFAFWSKFSHNLTELNMTPHWAPPRLPGWCHVEFKHLIFSCIVFWEDNLLQTNQKVSKSDPNDDIHPKTCLQMKFRMITLKHNMTPTLWRHVMFRHTLPFFPFTNQVWVFTGSTVVSKCLGFHLVGTYFSFQVFHSTARRVKVCCGVMLCLNSFVSVNNKDQNVKLDLKWHTV